MPAQFTTKFRMPKLCASPTHPPKCGPREPEVYAVEFVEEVPRGRSASGRDAVEVIGDYAYSV